jgi:hypothetical protein
MGVIEGRPPAILDRGARYQMMLKQSVGATTPFL